MLRKSVKRPRTRTFDSTRSVDRVRSTSDSGTRRRSRRSSVSQHVLCETRENSVLFDYEQRSKSAFDGIVDVLKQISALQHEADFEEKAQQMARQKLGFNLPDDILSSAWVDQLDMKRLYAWSVFETYKEYCNTFYGADPLRHMDENSFDEFIQECGFHTVDVSPCADGRLAHVIRYVLRLPHKAIRRKSYAGATFDVEDSIQKWVETEFLRFREGKPNTADEPTRYLKVVTYHLSSIDGAHEGCAAHGSDDGVAAKAGLDRLIAFKKSIENSFCCGSSIDILLIGVDTATDAIRVHVPNENGDTSLTQYVDSMDLYKSSLSMNEQSSIALIERAIRADNSGVTPGMFKFVNKLLVNNFSQIEYVKNNIGASYPDIGHAERFIGAGVGFEEIQLRNLMYFAYLNTIEEATMDIDVGIKIFTGLNVSKGLPVPIVVRFDHHSHIEGSKERAAARCKQVAEAIMQRFEQLYADGFVHILQVTRDCDSNDSIELLNNTVIKELAGAH